MATTTNQGLFNNDPVKTNLDPNYVSNQSGSNSNFNLLGSIIGGITNNPGLDALGRTYDRTVNFLSKPSSYAGGNANNQGNQNLVSNTNFTPVAGVKYTNQGAVQPVTGPVVTLPSQTSSKPILDTAQQINQTPVNNQPRYTYNGPINTPFGSTPMNNQPNTQVGSNQYNTNTGGLMGNFNFTNDSYNTGLRDTSKQDLNNYDQTWRDRTANMFNGSIADMLVSAQMGNQDRQRMRVAKADFTNANNLACRNLEHQNQSGLQDLISQRNTDMDSQKLAETTRNNQVDNQYKYDYINQYLQPQLAQQREQQQNNLAIERQKLQQGSLKSNLEQQVYNSYNPTDEQMAQYRNTAMNSDVCKVYKSQLDNKQITQSEYDQKINDYTTGLARQNADAQANILNMIFNQSAMQKNQAMEDVETIAGPDGKPQQITTKIKRPVGSGNSVAKTSGNTYVDTVAGGVVKT